MSTPMSFTDLATGLALDDNKVTPGLLGFVVFAALGVATWFLVKSMNKQFKRVDFVEEPEPVKE
ncbi:hypothetical protein [Saccharothrix sp. ST-888]|uniref:hypothetical protein n=1 Tax=Saccharothrix sp. ST-888 TaxID=1427391 RepID=UPI0005EC7318|nr:hypothetical protein [Saccharothrix sp. ST-888]